MMLASADWQVVVKRKPPLRRGVVGPVKPRPPLLAPNASNWGESGMQGWSGFHVKPKSGAEAPAARPYRARRRRSELRTTNTDEQAIAALASMGESSPAIASGTINTL